MFPKPKPSLSPNTYAYESEPLVKPTGFREYDARWLFEKEINLMGVQALGMGLGTLIRQMGVRPGDRRRPRLPQLFRRDQIRAGVRPDGGRMQGPRHRPRGDADGLFRAVRARHPLRRHGDRVPQRQRLDRREDGRAAPAHLRAGRDGPPQGHRARREVRSRAAAAPTCSSRISRRATSPTSPTGRSSRAGSRWWRRAATAPPAPSHRRCWRRSAARWCRSTASSTTPSRATIRTPKTWRCCTRSATRCSKTRPISASASTATATAAAWSTTRARRSSPTRSASCWRATCRACIPMRSSSST